MSSIYLNKTYIYSKKNIAGFEFLDENNKNFRKLCHYEEAIKFINSLGGKIENARVFVKEENIFGIEVYDIKADGINLINILDRSIIFNLNVLYNEREKYYEEYKDIFDKFICIINF